MQKIRGIDKYLIKQYSIMLRKNPTSFVFLPLADAYKRRGMPEVAIEICSKGISLHPEHMSGKALLGELYYICKRYNEAEKMLKVVTMSIPDNIAVRKLLILIYIKKGKLDKAIKIAEELIIICNLSSAYDSLKEDTLKQLELCRSKQNAGQETTNIERSGDTGAEEKSNTKKNIDSESTNFVKLAIEPNDAEIINDEAAFDEIGKLFEDHNEIHSSKPPTDKIDHVDMFKRMLSNIKFKGDK